MPYVNIKITREGGTTPSQKAALIRGVTELLQNVLGKSPSTTFVIIDEVDMENWGIAGLPVEEYRRKQSAE
jgi:4-oxalocrotonate tautomerase